MTAHPNSFDFMTPEETGSPVLVRPKVVERYWGYEVAKNELEIDLAVLGRCAACLMMMGACLAALGVWAMPAMFVTSTVPFGKLLLSLIFLAIAGTLFRIVTRSTRVRVQIDTATGEMREVVAGPFGADIVLTHYGLDAIDSVDVAASRLDPSIGQLHIGLRGGEVIPAGDGTLIALRHLRDRVAADCGLCKAAAPQRAEWGGPIDV